MSRDDPFAGRYDTPELKTARDGRIRDVFGGFVATLHPEDQHYLNRELDSIFFDMDKLEYEIKRLKTLVSQEQSK